MHPLKFISVKLTLCLISGILIGYFLPLKPAIPIIVLVLLLTVLGFVFKQKEKTLFFGVLASIVTIVLGIVAVTLSRPNTHFDHYTNRQLPEFQIWHVKIRELLKSNAYSDRYVANVIHLDNRKTSGKILLTCVVDSQNQKFKVDDEILIYTKPDGIEKPLNPFQFNYKKYMEHLGIEHQLKLSPHNHMLKKEGTVTVFGLAAAFRSKIITQLQKNNFKDEELGVIQALLLGQRNDISEQTYTHYKDAGAVHILAVSGLHIGILLLLLEFLLKPLERLPNGRKIKLFAIVLLLWGFALLAGFSASIIRAVTMFTFVAYALYLNRPTSTFNILALSMFFILLVNPMLLFQVGFQMSYAAVFAIVWIYPLLQKLWTPNLWLVQTMWRLLSVSIAAQLGVLPISLFYFHQFPALFFISNLTIIPFLGFILSLGIVVIALALFHILPNFIAVFYNWTIATMNSVIAWVAQQEAFVFKNIAFGWSQLVWSYVIIISGVLLVTKVSYKRTLTLLIAVIGFQSWSLYELYNTKKIEIFVIAHQTRNSVLLHQIGNKLHVITADSLMTEKLVADYSVGAQIGSVAYQLLKNSYQIGKNRLFIMDNTGIIPENLTIDYLMLSQSPKVNLDRILASQNIKLLIADGSNYRSYVANWKATCEQRNIPFHYTGEGGAFYLDLGE